MQVIIYGNLNLTVALQRVYVRTHLISEKEKSTLRRVLESLAERIKTFADTLTGAESRILVENSDNLLALAKELNKALKTAVENDLNADGIAKYSKGKYNKHTWYSEFNAYAMRWRNNTNTKVGDTTIISENMNVAVLIEATETGI